MSAPPRWVARPDAGLCPRCDAPVAPGRRKCARHLEMDRAASGEKYKALRAAGVCVECHVADARPGKTMCAPYAAKVAAKVNRRYHARLEAERAARIEAASLARSLHHRTREVGATKTREVRTVPEHPELRRELESWRRWGWRAEYGRDPREEDLVVPAREGGGRPWGAAEDAGGAWRQQAIHRALGRALDALRLPTHRVHDLRHTFASLCADAGMRELVAARWTHAPGGGSARHLYAVPSWAAQCAEMQLLKINFTPPEVGALNTKPRDAAGERR